MNDAFKDATVTHDRDNCIGCGMCSLLCPKYWTMNPDDGKADLAEAKKVKHLHQRKVGYEDVAENKAAQEACPVNVIKVHQ
ncbi:MAG: ferredoxin [Candidatus Pacebacteria bacterium]|nr:ferredoxin [Candidatus Paceibacterota bacterium]PIR63405.1 MAG: ferredoxin [Candidatus Pacebacteria bacterium CG10_big_fil_rev_8_21_14_0_10_40_26]PIZ79609.1 MAG: ferredoxin [Candidatus Pacebacteria bacterium CG_4_10_14_0_2_um_filter_40_20]PJA69062.1 MAG: ferredoxin [Candidatus Pacebacteria bacterium CG_4_9_14_3_um_filter_40_12]PJC41804.1 MAG: ferredoxin [Candidatus Pacebacteria bacterium CG_4_9_14_0_2_um_filter_40_15]